MIDVSSLRNTTDAFRLTTPSKLLRTHTDNLKNRRIILARYQKVGNAQDFSQIPQTERDIINIAGQKARSESRERKQVRPSTQNTRENCESGTITNLKLQTQPFMERRVVISRSNSQPSLLKFPVSQRSQLSISKDFPGSTAMRTQTQILSSRKDSEMSILREKKETDIFEERAIRSTLGHLDEPTKTRRSPVIRPTNIMVSEGNEKKFAGTPLKDMKAVTSFVAIAKFLKKKGQAAVARKSPKKEKPEPVMNITTTQVRVVKIINPEIVEENNNMVCNYSNPIASIYEDIPSEEFHKSLAEGLLNPKKLLEYMENKDMWDTLGELIDIHTDQKLEYQVTYARFKKNRHFNTEDYGLLEWRSQKPSSTVRKIYHRQTLKVFALKSINLEKFNNDPTDIKNDIRISNMLSKHSHKGILRFISSRLGIAEANPSPRGRRTGSVDILSELKANLSMSIELVGELGVVSLKELNNLRKRQGIKWTENELIVLLKELSSALAHCEGLGIAHRNIKPSNIFFGEDRVTTKLTDFKLGLLTAVRKQKTIETNVVGTPRYMSYELKRVYNNLKAKKIAASMIKYDPFLSDVSSLALVILELAMVSLEKEKEIKLEIESAIVILKEIKDFYPNLSKLLQKMLVHEPAQRPRFNEVEACLILPAEVSKRQIYESRYSMVSELDDAKRENERIVNMDDYMEMTKVYVRLAMNERATKKAQVMKEYSEWKRDKNSKKEEKTDPVTEHIGVLNPTYKASAVKMLNICYEEFRKKGQHKKATLALNLMGDILYQVYQTDELSIFVYVLCNLARLSQFLNQCKESVGLYVQAYTIAKKCYGEKSLPIAVLLNNIGSLYYSTGETQRVKEVFERALKIKEELGLKSEITYAIGLHNMANTNQITGDIKSAVTEYHDALQVYTAFFENVIKETGELYLAISVLHYANRGDRDGGEQYIKHALDIYEEAPDETRDFLLGVACYRLGLFRYCFKEYEMAYDAYEKAIKLLESSSIKQVGLIDAIKESQRALRNEAGFLMEIKKAKAFLI